MVKEMEKKKKSLRVQRDILVSVAIVVNNDSNILEKTIDEVYKVLSSRYEFYEILIVDNGSTDTSYQIIRKLQKQIPNIHLLVLSKFHGLEVAYTAILDNSIGDYLILLDVYRDPPSLIPTFVSKAMAGYDIVVGEREDTNDLFVVGNLIDRVSYKILKYILGYDVSKNYSLFRLLNRKVVNSIIRIKNKSRNLNYLSTTVGFKQIYIPYKSRKRNIENKNKVDIVKSFLFMIDILTSNSNALLRLSTILGVLAGLCNLLFLVFIFLVAIFKKRIAEGWITSNVLNACMFFLIFIILAIMSEYIATILKESKDQPLYFISEDHHSNVLKKRKLNIV